MPTKAIEKDVIIKRINGIQQKIAELAGMNSLSFNEFKDGDAYKLAQYHLHRALEGVFNISSHILSRIPGGEATQYREIAEKLGEFGIVDKEFAAQKLIPMAKYRNRLVHFYAEITEKELYDIIKNDLSDFGMFFSAIKKVLESPEQFNLTVE